jgi:hypothetical protein
MTKENNFTSLVGVKWNKKSMIKVHDMMWNSYCEKLLKTKRLSLKEKHKRFDYTKDWMNNINWLCLTNDIAFKKKEDKDKK